MDIIISNIIKYMLQLIDEQDTQQALAEYLKSKRKQGKLSREKLAIKSGVPAPTIKKFETTGQISLRQFLLLWLSLDDINRLYNLTKAQKASLPTTIEEVLSRDY